MNAPVVTCCAAETRAGKPCANWRTRLMLIRYWWRKQSEVRRVYLCATHRAAAKGRHGIGLPNHGGKWWKLADDEATRYEENERRCAKYR